MMTNTIAADPALYLADETAWLDATAELIRAGRLADVDTASLAEYLTDMANRDRREVSSRLTVLLMHLLKWEHQPAKRSRSWIGSIMGQQQELADFLTGVLLRHANEVLPDVYANAVARAARETGLPATTFPAARPYTVERLLADNLISADGLPTE
jgi:hypothetical protein